MKILIAIVISHIIVAVSCQVDLCGVVIEGESWPWLSSVLARTPNGMDFLCSGTLISDKHVVLAAHCLQKPNEEQVAAKDLIVNIGKNNLFASRIEDGGLSRKVKQAILHPHYNVNDPMSGSDLAVLVLAEPIDPEAGVRPACLWKHISYKKREHIIGTVVAWGKDEEGKISEEPTQIKMPVFSHEECVNTSPYIRTYIANNTFCAVLTDATGPCEEDYGGEMYVQENMLAHGDRWILRGVLTKFLATEENDICKHAVFTDVTMHLPWLKKIVNKYQTLETAIVGDKVYYFSDILPSKYLTWNESKEFCKLHGMELARFETVLDHETVTNFAAEAFIEPYTYWIDGTDEGHEGHWVWSTTGKVISIKAWRPGQPENYMRGEHCLGFNPSEGYQSWHDIPCPYKFRFICQRHIDDALGSGVAPHIPGVQNIGGDFGNGDGNFGGQNQNNGGQNGNIEGQIPGVFNQNNGGQSQNFNPTQNNQW